MKIKSIKIISMLLAVLVLMTALTGCTEAGRDLLMGFVQEWFNTKFGIDTTDNSTGGKIMNGIRIGILFSKDSTGNPDADAALGTVKMVKNFAQAESQMDLGRRTDNATAMDAAIKLRPDDWSYQVSRGTLALKQNDVNTAKDDYGNANNICFEEGRNNATVQVQYRSQAINELEAWKNTGKLDVAPLTTQDQAYWELLTAYQGRETFTHSAKDRQMADYYLGQYNTIHHKLYPNSPPIAPPTWTN